MLNNWRPHEEAIYIASTGSIISANIDGAITSSLLSSLMSDLRADLAIESVHKQLCHTIFFMKTFYIERTLQ